MSFFHKPQFKKIAQILVIVLLVLLVVIAADARAGGAGGGHSSSGGSHFSGGGGGGGGSSGGDLMIIWFLFEMIGRLFGWLFATIGPLPTLLIIAGIIALIYFARRKQVHDAGNVWNNLPEVPTLSSTGKVSGMAAFRKRNPNFDEAEFIEKVRVAFTGIQEAWSKQNLGPVRRFISDGVYQRFNTQFRMMKLLEQTNPISHLRIENIKIDRADTDQNYDILQVVIRAHMRDSFRCGLNSAFNQEGDDTFTEYWSFIRRQDRSKQGGKDSNATDITNQYSDMYQSTACPNCGAQLPADLGERGECPYCKTLVNSGEYDWVLSEITQAEDYTVDQVIDQNSNLKSGLNLLAKEDPDFCVQLAEDKASNAFMQILATRATRDPALMRRFVNDHAFQRISQLIPKDPIVYNRLYLNRVGLNSIHQDSEQNTLAFGITMSSQRVLLDGRKVRVIDPALCQEEIMLLMSRSRNPGESKGSLYMHQCANCGAPIQDSLEVACPYCQQPYNSGKQEWVVSDIMAMSEYRSWIRESPRTVKARVNPALYDNLYDVRDYAMGNLMVMIAADGVFAEEERVFAEAMATQLGFKVDNLQALFELARNGKLGLRMPNDISKRGKIIAMMQAAASADGTISAEEQQILDYLSTAFITTDVFRS